MQSLLGIGIMPVTLVVLAMLGHIDLRPSTMRTMLADSKTLNDGLVDGLNGHVLPALESSAQAVKIATDELASIRREVQDLRLEIVRLRGPQ